MKTSTIEPTAVVIVMVIGVVIAVILFVVQRISAAMAEEERRKELYSKYGRTALAEKLISRTFWTGETAQQLRDSLGAPLDIDQKILKTKRKEIWKYNRTGTNRYALKITLDNDVVAGWDQK